MASERSPPLRPAATKPLATKPMATEPNHPLLSRSAATGVCERASTFYAAKRPRAPEEDSPDDRGHRATKELRLLPGPIDDDIDEISSCSSESSYSSDRSATVDANDGKIHAHHIASGKVLLSIPDPNGGRAIIKELNREHFERFKELSATIGQRISETQDNSKRATAAMDPMGGKAPWNIPDPQHPANRPTTKAQRPGDERGPATASDPSNVRPRIVVEGASLTSGELRFQVNYGKFYAWCRFKDLQGEEGGLERFNQLVKSDRFMKAGGSAAPKPLDAWKLFLQGNPMSNIPYTAPTPFPKHLEHAKKKVIATRLVGGMLMVCLEVETKVEVGPAQWGNDKQLLDACAKYCVDEEDWTTLLL